MSSINEYWQSKDGMVSNTDALAGTWCGKPFAEDGELDNDWIIVDGENKAYNANLFVLNAKFKRDLIGTSNKDFTYKIGKEYDYIITYGVWKDSQESGAPTVPPGQTPETSTLEVTAGRQYAPLKVVTAAYDDTFAHYLPGVTAVTSALIVATSLY